MSSTPAKVNRSTTTKYEVFGASTGHAAASNVFTAFSLKLAGALSVQIS